MTKKGGHREHERVVVALFHATNEIAMSHQPPLMRDPNAEKTRRLFFFYVSLGIVILILGAVIIALLRKHY